jgi:hypothetical protein
MATIDIPAAGAPARQAEFRTCGYTGLKVDLAAQRLIKVNAVAAVLFLALGGLMGILVAMTRWPAVHLLPADWFYLVLTGHGANVLLFWILFFEMALLYFASAILLNSRLATPRLATPELALIFLSIGPLAILYELMSPGAIIPGVLGAIMLILGFFSLAVLPVNLVYQKYFDPFMLLAVALFARPGDLRRPRDYAGVAVVCVASIAYALSFAGD